MLNFLRRKRKVQAAAAASVDSKGIVGKYDIRGSRIAGILGKVPEVQNGAIWIEARRGRILVAEQLVPDKGGLFLDFSMDIGDRFTLEELARETVIISARNERGDSGELIMNGTTRLELIRKYLGIPAETVFDLDFSRKGNARPYLGAGWSAAESLFTWAVDQDSFVRFDSPTTPGHYILRLKFSSFITEFVHLQSMDILINENFIDTITEDRRSIAFHQMRVNWEVFDGRPVSELRLHHPRAARPDQQLGHKDKRALSFCFYNLSLVRRLDADS